ncbi:cell division protein FtsZ [Williamsoniiplasma lucivorax]|uniref:Cell division protein FtsZ n=1 Tax=Williamsoniiplasma lucivorax TaxID=209274 RepID=A0A2S5RDQ4_9MOLU|nr:cell division protein FtsZ [Williamsoniiplasma lucivorax]PPE05451.1 cell division protein FtsZ [Williamsoniiplasma lucivorax]
MEQKFDQIAKIKVIGVGGGGNNAVNRMINEGVQGVDFIVANTDAQVLSVSKAPTKLILGEKISKGLGAGANPEIGKQAALESIDQIKESLEGADLVFVAAGMGGGTGTGAAPIIAKVAQESGALVVAIVTKPFRFEGKNRNKFAIEGLTELKKHVDSVIVISNDKLLEYIGGLPIEDSFKEADSILKQGVQTITDLIAVPAVINLDFADVRTVMSKKGNALFGIGIAEGPDKAVQAANKAISSSLLEASIFGSKDVIVNITGGKTVSLNDAYDAVDIIQQAAGSEDVNIVFGIAINSQLNDELIVTVIATGFDQADVQQQQQNTILESQRRQVINTNNFDIESLKQKEKVFENKQMVDRTIKLKQQLNNEVDEEDDDFPTFLK